MDRILRHILALLTAWVCAAAQAEPLATPIAAPLVAPLAVPRLPVLCWHDVRDAQAIEQAGNVEATTVTTRDLVAQFELIRMLGYSPISLAQWHAAREGRAKLPAKPVLLTFDDGYKSLYTRVYPLLKLYRYPAVASIVSEWMSLSDDQSYAAASSQTVGKQVPADLVSWGELREMTESGLLEVASHSHALHAGVVANPQGNEQPAGIARQFNEGSYESDTDFRLRLYADLFTSRRILEEQLGTQVQALVWPYGEYSQPALEAARQAGYSSTFGLSYGVNTTKTAPMTMKRTQVLGANSLTDVVRFLQMPDINYAQSLGTLRTLSISLDDVYDPIPEHQEVRLALLVDAVRRLGVNTVIVHAASQQEDASGRLPVYFATAYRPLKSDLLNHASAQLRHRAGVQVWVEWSLASTPERAREDTAAFDDLGKFANFSGVVVRLPNTDEANRNENVKNARDRLARARGWRPDLATAIALEFNKTAPLHSRQNTELPLGVELLLSSTQADFLIARGVPTNWLPAAPRRAGLRSGIAETPNNSISDQLIVEARSPDSAVLSSDELALAFDQQLNLIDGLLGQGLRHIGVQQNRTGDLTNQIERLWPRLSTITLRRVGL